MRDLFLNHFKTKNISSQDLIGLPASLCCSCHVNMGHSNSADPEEKYQPGGIEVQSPYLQLQVDVENVEVT